MRQLTLVLPILFLSACDSGGSDPDRNASGNATPAAQEDRYTVRAGPIANARIGALSGNFQLLKVGAPSGIPSSGTGGACIVFAAADLGYVQMAGKRCETNAQCNTGEGESAAYCDAESNSCWARPGTDASGSTTCNRPVTMTPATLNPVPRQAVDAAALGVRPGAKARVVACLNKGSPPFPGRPPCGQIDSDDRIEVMGPVATVR